jgi:hypothetical protein
MDSKKKAGLNALKVFSSSLMTRQNKWRAWGQSYKTFFVRDLRIFVLINSVC